MESVPKQLPLRLPYRPPFAKDPLLSFLAIRAVPGVEDVHDGTYRRGVQATEGGTAVIAMTPHPGYVRVNTSAGDVRNDQHLAAIVRGARRTFDLDADPQTIDAALTQDTKLAPLVRRTPGMRVPGTFDAFELVVRAIFGQQVSVRGARASLGRFAKRFGTPLDPPGRSVTHLFPTPDRVTDIPPETFEMPRSRAHAIRRVAELVALGQLDLSGSAPPEDALQILGEVRGIGPWTLAYVAMRALRDPDAFVAGDLGVRKGFEALGLPSGTRELLDRAERWRPWRAYAVMHLWHAHT
ncbi:MAG: DNA-3-methyladenine glycosylase [Actinomycetota bacterium]|nr:DNA-3-methyladenine glycosylase [Actinomycetota bacterium]